MNLEENIKFIGFKRNILRNYCIAVTVLDYFLKGGAWKVPFRGDGSMAVFLIATNTRGLRNLIKNEKNGFLVEVGDYKQTAEYMDEVIYLNTERRKELIDNSKKRVSNYYIDNVLCEISRFY